MYLLKDLISVSFHFSVVIINYKIDWEIKWSYVNRCSSLPFFTKHKTFRGVVLKACLRKAQNFLLLIKVDDSSFEMHSISRCKLTLHFINSLNNTFNFARSISFSHHMLYWIKVSGDYAFLTIHVFMKAIDNFFEIQFFQKNLAKSDSYWNTGNGGIM